VPSRRGPLDSAARTDRFTQPTGRDARQWMPRPSPLIALVRCLLSARVRRTSNLVATGGFLRFMIG
jgi:hypothetical protein